MAGVRDGFDDAGLSAAGCRVAPDRGRSNSGRTSDESGRGYCDSQTRAETRSRAAECRWVGYSAETACRNSSGKKLQEQLQIERARNRVFTVGRNLEETATAVQSDRILHRGRDGIEAHALVTDVARFRNYPIHQQPPEADAPRGGTHIETLHLANTGLERAESDASGRPLLVGRQQQTALRRSIGTRKIRYLLIKA